MTGGAEALVLTDVAAGYGRRRVIEGVSAVARGGRITVLLGPNAAGKTTLLRCVTGGLGTMAGTVSLGGRAPHRLRGRALAERVAWVPQHPEVSGAFTVREVVEMGRFALGPAPKRVAEVMHDLELEPVAGQAFPSLSAGQQQRVALARALAQHEPGTMLVLDEPVASMDLAHARSAFGLLRRCARAGSAVLIVLHDLAAAVTLADEVWILDRDGSDEAHGISRLVAAGPVDETVTVERLQAVFGAPFEWVRRTDGSTVLVSANEAE